MKPTHNSPYKQNCISLDNEQQQYRLSVEVLYKTDQNITKISSVYLLYQDRIGYIQDKLNCRGLQGKMICFRVIFKHDASLN